MLRKKWLIPQRGNLMNSLKRIAAAALSAALCFSIAVPAYADHYQTPKSIKGVLINEHAQIPDVLEVVASQVVLNNALKDTDYGIAWHAYPETFEDPVFSDDQYVQEKADTYIINLKNLHILTDYMQKADMLLSLIHI